jgi:hypothetical protein
MAGGEAGLSAADPKGLSVLKASAILGRRCLPRPREAERFPNAVPMQHLAAAARLYELAVEVRRIGNGYRHNPEQIAEQKDDIASDLIALARELEAQ